MEGLPQKGSLVRVFAWTRKVWDNPATKLEQRRAVRQVEDHLAEFGSWYPPEPHELDEWRKSYWWSGAPAKVIKRTKSKSTGEIFVLVEYQGQYSVQVDVPLKNIEVPNEIQKSAA